MFSSLFAACFFVNSRQSCSFMFGLSKLQFWPSLSHLISLQRKIKVKQTEWWCRTRTIYLPLTSDRDFEYDITACRWLDSSLAQSRLTNLLWYFPSLLPRNGFMPHNFFEPFSSVSGRGLKECSVSFLKACRWIILGTFLYPPSPSVFLLSGNLNLNLSTTKCLSGELQPCTYCRKSLYY